MNWTLSFWLCFLFQLQMCIGALIENCIDDICIPSNYNRHVRPILNETNDIQVDLTNIKILKVDDKDCTVTISIWLYLKWIDPRLLGIRYFLKS